MTLSAGNGENASTSGNRQIANGVPQTQISTLPDSGHNWQVTLRDKVIASKLMAPAYLCY